MFWSNKNKFKLLSFSGGSEKGIISLILALKLENELKKHNPEKEFIEYFDAVTALSSGSLIAGCLVAPSEATPKKPKNSLKDCMKLFNNGFEIIGTKNTTWNKILLFAGFKDTLISNSEVEKILLYSSDSNEKTYNTKLSQAIIPIYIVSYDADNTTPRIWNTYEAKSNPKKDFTLKDAVMASIALPPLLPKQTIISTDQEKLIDYDGGLITPSPLFVSLPYIAKVNNIEINDFFITSIGTTIQDVKEILKDFDTQYILFKATDYISISQQITKPVFDAFLKYVYKEFYKLDLKVPSKIQQSLYSKNKKEDLDNYNKMIACTLKYIDENKEFFTALGNKIADKKQDMKKLEKLYDDSNFYCENPEEALAECGEQAAIKLDL